MYGAVRMSRKRTWSLQVSQNGKRSIVQHDRFMGLAVLLVVDDLIYAGLAHGLSGAKNQAGVMTGQIFATKFGGIFICRDDSGMKCRENLPAVIYLSQLAWQYFYSQAPLWRP